MKPNRVRIPISLALVALCTGLLGMVTPATAEDVKTVEWYLEQARPHLHHSCQSAWDSVEQDQDRFIDMVGTISAVSFYNHDFDIERLNSLSEEKQDAFQMEFYEEVGELCRQNNQALLAGVVDFSLTGAIAKVAAEEQ
jgi:hypothetical protein